MLVRMLALMVVTVSLSACQADRPPNTGRVKGAKMTITTLACQSSLGLPPAASHRAGLHEQHDDERGQEEQAHDQERALEGRKMQVTPEVHDSSSPSNSTSSPPKRPASQLKRTQLTAVVAYPTPDTRNGSTSTMVGLKPMPSGVRTNIE